MAVSLQDPHPEVELAPPVRALPIVEPRLRSPLQSPDISTEHQSPSILKSPTIYDQSIADFKPTRARPESYNFSGSTYLITDTGKTLKLPVPSDSVADPLNWGKWKTAGAIFAISLYSIVCLTAAQAASVVLDGIQNDFGSEVSCSSFISRTYH